MMPILLNILHKVETIKDLKIDSKTFPVLGMYMRLYSIMK